MSNEPAILTTIEDQIATLTLNRPDKRNAINDDIVEGLRDALRELEPNDDVRAIVLRGAGKMFSSGIDATWLAQLGTEDDQGKLAFFLRLVIEKVQSLNNYIERIEKPVIAALHGRCIGLGLEIALACDFRIATDDCLISLPEVVLGLVPDCGGTTRVTRFAGPAVAKEVVMLCEQGTAEQYHKWNLINRVCPADGLDEAVKQMAETLLDRPRFTLGVAKRLIDRGAGLDKLTHMEMEALANSSLVIDKNFPQILMEGFQKLRKKG